MSKTLTFAKKYLFPFLSSFELFPPFEQPPQSTRLSVASCRKAPVGSSRVLQTSSSHGASSPAEFSHVNGCGYWPKITSPHSHWRKLNQRIPKAYSACAGSSLQKACLPVLRAVTFVSFGLYTSMACKGHRHQLAGGKVVCNYLWRIRHCHQETVSWVQKGTERRAQERVIGTKQKRT